MRKILLLAFLGVMLVNCNSLKRKELKTQETKQIDSTKVVQSTNKKTKDSSFVNNTSSESKLDIEKYIVYKPQYDENGNLKPFEYKETANGKEKSSITVTGNGEVLIKSLESSFSKENKEFKIKLQELQEQLNITIASYKEQLEKQEQVTQVQKQSIFKLWIIIIVLSILLLISIYLHLQKIKLPKLF